MFEQGCCVWIRGIFNKTNKQGWILLYVPDGLCTRTRTVPKKKDFSRYNMKCSEESEIQRGIFHVVSRFLLHFMLYHGNLDNISNSAWHWRRLFVSPKTIFVETYSTHICMIVSLPDWVFIYPTKNSSISFLLIYTVLYIIIYLKNMLCHGHVKLLSS